MKGESSPCAGSETAECEVERLSEYGELGDISVEESEMSFSGTDAHHRRYPFLWICVCD